MRRGLGVTVVPTWVILTFASSAASGCSGGSEPVGEPSTSVPATTDAPSTVAPSITDPVVPTSAAPVTDPATSAGTGDQPPPDPDRGDVVALATADLAERFAYDPDDISVAHVESVLWRDAALGCPAVDREYDPTPVPGYRIVLVWRDLDFHYHGADGSDDPPRLCQFLD